MANLVVLRGFYSEGIDLRHKFLPRFGEAFPNIGKPKSKAHKFPILTRICDGAEIKRMLLGRIQFHISVPWRISAISVSFEHQRDVQY